MFDGSMEDKKFVNMLSKSFSSDSNVNVEVAVSFAFRVWDAFPAFFFFFFQDLLDARIGMCNHFHEILAAVLEQTHKFRYDF